MKKQLMVLNLAGLMFSRVLGVCLIAVFAHESVAAITSVTDTSCNSRLDVTVASSTRSSAVSSSDCQIRTLDTTAGFVLSAAAPSGSTTPDSSSMVSAGGELYESFVTAAREAAVLLTPNRALMMSRSITGDRSGTDWKMGLAVQPVNSATNAWLTGTYTLLRANRDVRIVDSANQTDAALSEIFDPVTLRITFDGNSGCSITNYSSWFSYSLTTDPAGAFSQPDGNDYGLHQAVYAGEGYAGIGGVHEDSVRSFTDCDYVLSSDGKLLITYDYEDGDSVAHSVENSYFVSADLRYLVSTVDAGVDLYRGFEVGVRVKTIAGTQDERNDGVAATYLFNAPTFELQGATGVLSEPDNEHRANEKATHCMARGSAVLSTADSATSGWNTCTWDMTYTCSSRGEEGEVPAITLQHITAEGSNSSAACRFQVAADGSVDFVVSIETAEGVQDVTYSGAVADNNEGLVLRGKYVGSVMTDPSDTNPPERQIKNVLLLQALVGLKYDGTLTADADGDGLNNLGEFLYSEYIAASIKNDFDTDGDADVLLRSTSLGSWRLFNVDVGAVVSNAFFNVYSSSAVTHQANLDADGDGDADVLVRNSSTGAWTLFTVQNGATTGSANLGLYTSATWSYQGHGDFDGDGDDDILLRSSAGAWRLFTMEAGAVSGNSQPAIWATTNLVFQAVGDFDGDGDDDVVGRLTTTGEYQIFRFQSGAVLGNTFLALWQSSAWTLQFAADLDADGDDDMVIRDSVSGAWQSFPIQNNGVTGTAYFNLWANPARVSLAANGDYDGDGDSDVILRLDGAQYYRFNVQSGAVTGSGFFNLWSSADYSVQQ